MPMLPVKKELTPEIPAARIDRESLKLLKKVWPPLSSNPTNKKNNPRNAKKRAINLIDHLPKEVFGVKIIFIGT